MKPHSLNGMIALFAVALASSPLSRATTNLSIDDFEDGAADPTLWQPFTVGVGPSVTETNGVLEIFHPSTAADGSGQNFFMAGYDSIEDCKLSGDYDIRVDYTLTVWPPNNGVRVGLNTTLMATERLSLGTPADFTGVPRGDYYLTDPGSFAFDEDTTDVVGSLRQVRSGSTVTGYYKSGGIWEPIDSITNTSTAPVSFRLASWSHNYAFTDQSVRVSFDNLTLHSGTLDGPSGLCGARPIADAGPDQTVAEGDGVVLDGSNSSGATNFSWIQISGAAVALDEADPVHPTFIAPFVGMNSTLTFELTVDGGSGADSDTDTVDVTVVNTNNPPVADAGDDGTSKPGETVSLDGSKSFDPEGDSPLLFSWAQTAGTPVTLVPSDAVVDPRFTAPSAVGDVLTFELVVGDGRELGPADAVDITMVDNSRPVADAGSDRTVDEGTLVQLDGTNSSDNDGGDTLSFSWSGPVALSDASSPTPSFTVPTVGAGGQALIFELVVTDDDPVNQKSSLPDEVTISARNVNDPPSCELARASCPDSKLQSNEGCTLWPPNHKMVSVSVVGVVDSGSDDVAIEIVGVTQDEPVNSGGDGDTSPDAVVRPDIQVDTVLIRAERTGLGGAQENGRVYRVSFIADDGMEACAGAVTVGVPHDRKDTPVDDGQLFDSEAL